MHSRFMMVLLFALPCAAVRAQGVTGGGLPARLWRAFMLRAMRLEALEREAEE